MKAQIRIYFKKIAGRNVDEKLLKENPNLPDVTRKTMIILCQQIKRYFQEHKIKTGVDYSLE